MIQAHKAERILELYEQDYDNFLDKLKQKFKQKKADAQNKKKEAQQKGAEANKAGQTVKDAEAHKKTHLADKAKTLLDKNGGITGAAASVQNVLNLFKKDTAPSDYEVGLGKTENGLGEKDKMIMGLPAMAVYIGGGVLLLGGLYALSVVMGKKNPAPVPGYQAPAVNPAMSQASYNPQLQPAFNQSLVQQIA